MMELDNSNTILIGEEKKEKNLPIQDRCRKAHGNRL